MNRLSKFLEAHLRAVLVAVVIVAGFGLWQTNLVGRPYAAAVTALGVCGAFAAVLGFEFEQMDEFGRTVPIDPKPAFPKLQAGHCVLYAFRSACLYAVITASVFLLYYPTLSFGG
jgi:hypothetical protein